MTDRKLIVANWKMNGSLASVRHYGAELAQRIDKPLEHAHIVVAPPFPYLMFMDGRLVPAGIALAAQDCSAQGEKGAFTGDVSAAMLKDVGCQYVILGHSERRHHYQESNAIIAKKIKLAVAAGLIPIFCVGETLTEREAGKTKKVIHNQLKEGLKEIKDCKELVVAYEPVWAIGTGRVPSLQDISSVCMDIQAQVQNKKITVKILYGGSVNADNAREILHLKGVDGALVGGASLTVEGFWAIVMAAS